MSAYVVDNETVNRIVSNVYEDSSNHVSPLYGQLGRLFGEPTSPQALQALAEDLLAMNQDAVMARYPGCDASNLPGPVDPKPIQYAYSPSDTIQTYKSATCLRYQCSEGDVPETDLFKKLDEACNIMAAAIVSSLPEYEAADWA